MLLGEIGGITRDPLDLAAEAEFGEEVYAPQVNHQERVLSEEKRTGHHENFRDSIDKAMQMVQRAPAPLGSLGGEVPGQGPSTEVPLNGRAPMPTGPGMGPQMNPAMDPRKTI